MCGGEMLAIPEQGGVMMPTKATDVYLYGCIMLQLFCGHVPYVYTRSIHWNIYLSNPEIDLWPRMLCTRSGITRTGLACSMLAHRYCSDAPDCPHCPQTDETVHHYLFECPQYQRERHILACELGRKSNSLSYILTDQDAIPHLVRYVNATHRLKPTLGELRMPTP